MDKTRCTAAMIVTIAIVSLLIPASLAANTGTAPQTGRSSEAPSKNASDFKVTLLGTSNPAPRPDRFGPSTLVEAGPEKLLFDCGRSCTTRLWQLNIPLGAVKLFITHLHSDHVVGIPDLWLTGWLGQSFGGRKEPFQVFGPKGTSQMMSYLEKAFQEDVRARREFNPSYTSQKVGIAARDFTEGVVYEENGVRVTAFKVPHDDIREAFGFRVDYKGRSVVISGDMAPNDNFLKYAQGADVVIHEVGAARPELLQKSAMVRRILETHHSSPEQAGRDFAQIRPKLAVYTHYSLFSGQGVAEATIPEIIARTRTIYSGPLEAGEDLMSISIGDTVTVHRQLH